MEPMSPRRSSRTVIAGISWPRLVCQFHATRFFCTSAPHGGNQDRSFVICEIAQATGLEFRS